MRSEITINPDLITWAVNRSGLSLRDFKQPVQEWIKGVSKPTVRKLEDFARKAMVPLGYLFLLSPPQESIGIPDFRTFGDEKRRTFSPNLRDIVTDIQRRQAWTRDYLVDAGNEPLDFVGKLKSTTSVVRASDQIRNRLELQNNWQFAESGNVYSIVSVKNELTKGSDILIRRAKEMPESRLSLRESSGLLRTSD